MSGIFGVVAQDDCVNDLFYGTDYHSHLGTQRAGLAVYNHNFNRIIHDITETQFKAKFAEDRQALAGPMGIGVISDRDPQPLIVGSKFGTFSLATAGLVDNLTPLSDELKAQGHSFVEMSQAEVNQTELVAKLINDGENLVQGMENAWRHVQGSVSLLLLTTEGIYAARDHLGRTPLVIGEKDGAVAVASETCAFSNLGYQVKRYLGPGEVVKITRSEVQNLRSAGERNQICSFLWIYTGYPASSYEGISVARVRERCGQMLAKRDDVEADLVAGVPDSGTGHAIGYAMESGWPFRTPLVKYTPGYGRSYTPPSQETRDRVAKLKLLSIREVIEGNRIVICEDSIVRGTQLRNQTVRKLWDAGAKEVHVRPACPPLMFPCKFALSTRTLEELAARRAIQALEGRQLEDMSDYLDAGNGRYQRMVDWIRDDLDCTTLRYQTLDDMIAAIGLPRERLCLYCWQGDR